MTTSEGNAEQLVRADDGILSDIWDALRKEKTIGSLDLGGLSIKVQNGEVYLDGYLKEENQPLVESTIQTVVGVVVVYNHLRTDDGIQADIWDALWKEDAIRSLDMGSLSVEVKGGEVYLDGHIAQENNLLRIENIVHSMMGVVAVHNNLVTDRELIVQVAQALARDERTHPYILPVNASYGWISLGGDVPTRELQHVAEKVAGEVTGVRGVIALPRVTGESPDMPRIAVQPRIGAFVYGRNLEEGVITQVVIQPEDRLVTHIIVRTNEIRDINLVTSETVVPVKAIDLVKDECVFLGRNELSLRRYPLFDPDEFPLAPVTWKVPYPYTAGEVRWSSSEIQEPGSHPSPRQEMKPLTEVQGLRPVA